MGLIPAFPKIFTVGDRFTRDLWRGPVEITEKIDGSQFNFGKVQGHTYMRSKGADIVFEDDNKMFDLAKAFVRSIEEKLPEGVIFHGEYLNKPRHNTLAYSRVPKSHFMLFGMSGKSDWMFPEYQMRSYWVDKFGCEEVPILFYGDAPEGDKYDWLMEFISEESALGMAQREGIVIKNYNVPVVLAGLSIPFLSAKLVSMEFKEKHQVAWKLGEGKDRLAIIGEAYNSKPRWLKAIQRRRDDGLLESSPRDIGPLLKLLHEDIEEEEKENIKEMLWKVFAKDVKRMAVSGFPEFYKDYLAHGLAESPNVDNVEEGSGDGRCVAVLPPAAAGDAGILPQQVSAGDGGSCSLAPEDSTGPGDCPVYSSPWLPKGGYVAPGPDGQ